MHTYDIYIRTDIHIYIYTHTYTHTYIHTFIYTYMHTLKEHRQNLSPHLEDLGN